MVPLPALGTFQRARSVKVNYSGLSKLLCLKIKHHCFRKYTSNYQAQTKKLETILKFSTHNQKGKKHFKDKIGKNSVVSWGKVTSHAICL